MTTTIQTFDQTFDQTLDQTLDLAQLDLVTGGNAQQTGRVLGRTIGTGLATVTPAPWTPIAQKLLPPAGAKVGGWVGHKIDTLKAKLPHLHLPQFSL